MSVRAFVRRGLGYAWTPAAAAAAGLLRLGRGLPVPWRLFESAGVLPIPLHYYQPYARERDLRAFWEARSDLAGVAVDLDAAASLLESLGREYGAECAWPRAEPREGGYYETNGTFGFSSAAVAHTLLRRLQPKRVVEVGSGYSTLILEGALRRNAEAGGRVGAEILSIEPFPPRVLAARFKRGARPDGTGRPDAAVRVRFDPRPVEACGLEPFLALGEDDVLFIDSSHIVRYGGDVLFLFLEVLPRLAPGVVVHIHDIHLPQAYPRTYYARSRWAWNEQYLLQAFLSGNGRFRTLLPCWWLHLERDEIFRCAFDRYDPGLHRPGSSWWMRAGHTFGIAELSRDPAA